MELIHSLKTSIASWGEKKIHVLPEAGSETFAKGEESGELHKKKKAEPHQPGMKKGRSALSSKSPKAMQNVLIVGSDIQVQNVSRSDPPIGKNSPSPGACRGTNLFCFLKAQWCKEKRAVAAWTCTSSDWKKENVYAQGTKWVE